MEATGPSGDNLTLKIRYDDSIVNEHAGDNKITTTKYTILTWLPKSLWEQFRRIANAYFLLISILMLIGYYAPEVYATPLNPYSTLATLIVVLMITSIKEGVEDVQRARSDYADNIRKVVVLRFDADGKPIETLVESQSIKAGDIIKLEGQVSVPADILLLHTSLYADGNQCYVETSNIDGETNLKLRLAPPQCRSLITSDIPNINLFKGSLEFEKPNKNIHEFIGTLRLDSFYEPIPLSAENMALRGSVFSNTEWAYGLAVYTGQESKLQLNNRLVRSKMSMFENYVNTAIVIIFFAQITTVTVVVISCYGLGYSTYSDFPYIYPDAKGDSLLPLWLETWIIYFLLLNNFIPISLYVTLELVNIGQSYLIASDIEIYDEALDSPCIVRSSNHVQELGVVSNIFSDKTGTLTRNEMKFVKFVVGNLIYDVEHNIVTDRGTEFESPVMKSLRDSLHSGKLLENPFYKFIHCIIACHTVVREKSGTFRSESPDELALVEGVGKFNCSLLERGTTSMTVLVYGERVTFEVLAVNAFNSDRKRMSVLVRDPSKKLFVLLKGADSTVLDLCKLTSEERHNVDKQLMSLACLGLRTLCIARKQIDEQTAMDWLKRWREAGSALHNRSGKLDSEAAALEKDMDYLGLTAIEDRLQDEVPEVIADLAKAGIVIWMLTGDKEETAINIGHSCNLLKQNTATFTLTHARTPEEFNMNLRAIHESIVARNYSNANIPPQSVNLDNTVDAPATDVSFVMDGPSFAFFKDDDLNQRKWLLGIGKNCRSVIGCRLTPLQKQQLVSIVKHDTVPRAITLSIGDGANDVSMIREADVGIGIIGKEGRQAANNADFAIGQFKFLRRLLLVHGRWNYMRQCIVFLYSMHKNLVLTFTLFWFSYLDATSGTSLYDTWIYSAFNFTLGLPIVFFGFMNRDVSAKFALAHPEIYATGMKNRMLDKKSILLWIFNACLYTIVICLVYYVACAPTFKTEGLYDMGTMIYLGMVMALQLKVIFFHSYWTHVNTAIMFISVAGIFLFILILTAITGDYIEYDVYGTANYLYNLGFFWFFGFFSVPLFCLLIDIVGQSLRIGFMTTEEMLYRERELLEKMRDTDSNAENTSMLARFKW